MAREVIILLLFSIFYGTEQCENFRYAKDVSAPNAIQIISNVSTESLDHLRGSCVSDCMSNINCNAIDVCGTYCRLIRGWDSLYTEQNAATTCQRFQIECAAGQFYDRASKTCVAHNYCDFEDDPEVSCFLTDDLADDDGNWIRNTIKPKGICSVFFALFIRKVLPKLTLCKGEFDPKENKKKMLKKALERQGIRAKVTRSGFTIETPNFVDFKRAP
uniref:Uncharacterized protein n=1 Tax=Magallana gigas TaxID=29159 RepID=K1PCI9_MAGGI